MGSAIEISLLHILVEKVKVHVNIIELLDHSDTSYTIALFI